MAPLTVVHLVRNANGVQSLRRFLDSYRKHEPGTPHDLLFLCKGFDTLRDVESDLNGVDRPFSLDQVSDDGMDIGAYLTCANKISTEFVCFLNSHCELQSDRWLEKLLMGLERPGVGVAGASGSFESGMTALLRQTRSEWGLLLRHPRAAATRARAIGNTARRFPLPPNPHLRTNAFVIRTSLFQRLKLRGGGKVDALEFEHGHRSMTRQLATFGLRPVVVGADGEIFEIDDWPESSTFRYRGQENLLVDDNQTRRYLDADDHERRFLGTLAWGSRFRSS